MDNSYHKPYHKIALAILTVAGFFLCLYVVRDHVPASTADLRAQVSGAFTTTGDTLTGRAYMQDRAQVIDWMNTIIRSQQATIASLTQELGKLQAQVDSLATSSSSNEEAIVEAPKRILLVAGHTQANPGTRYGDLVEYELNYQLMNETARKLRALGYEVITSHRGEGYSYRFSSFFEKNKDAILDFRAQHKKEYDEEYPQGVVTNDTDHNFASSKGVVQLYGINLWANTHQIDAVVHLHFNDYPGRDTSKMGKHSGFSIFTALKTNDNFLESYSLARYLERELLTHSARSTVTKESAGVLESELIAVGQANSVDAPAILVETGFIYESKFAPGSQQGDVLRRYATSISQAVDQYFSQ